MAALHQQFLSSAFLAVPLFIISAITLTAFKYLLKFVDSVANIKQDNPLLDAANPVFKIVDNGLDKLFGGGPLTFKFTDVLLVSVILAVLSLGGALAEYTAVQKGAASKKKKNK
mmetsp:Transcript_39177/g.51667  ORF Transcript_39177/g.51667 Transcript_39177/m.51667 type:complete len:114 (-) Transcript_39177:90-431(-)|eukprot:CAMPEP_0117764296 /NCGR_PEP_ID=MMETSP0947-20121206/19293_1 /TAXON_ID=44440 /ORGANISM="Chattonella subsalsa, Strain CCMP2191" /LENGTH=113 /DNA_ID=CAMNT_0005586455 /DNA_START=38 /DNA_END=379 /DNA_ORIENTATION=-